MLKNKFILSKNDKVLFYLEKNFIFHVMILATSSLVLLKIGTVIPSINQVLLPIDIFISSKLKTAFINRDSTLITLAAVFIGIYFTAFTLLATLSSKSSLTILNKNDFKALINYIRNAFIASFLYLFISLVSPLINNLGWMYSFLSISILLYMLLSALRFGLLIYLILNKDIDSFFQKVEEEKSENIKTKRIIIELDKFLEKEKNELYLKKADETSKMLEERKKIRK